MRPLRLRREPRSGSDTTWLPDRCNPIPRRPASTPPVPALRRLDERLGILLRMNRPAPVWLVVVLVAIAWFASRWTDSPPDRSEPEIPSRTGSDTLSDTQGDTRRSLATLENEVTSLRKAVAALQADVGGPKLRGSPHAAEVSASTRQSQSAPRATPSEDFQAREAQARQRREQEARGMEAGRQMKTWLDMVRQVGDRDKREEALAQIRAALLGTEPTATLAALRAARWLQGGEYDRVDFRSMILRHATSQDAAVRWAARSALIHVDPDPSDLAWWVEEAKSANRQNAEEVAAGLTTLSRGVIRGDVADAYLQLLRDGTNIKRAFVMRGLREANEFDPDVVARLVEIVRSAPDSDYDSSYFFHFVASRMDPKPDVVLDLALERFDQGAREALRGLGVGLSSEQQRRAADRLLTFAENADADWQLASILTELVSIANSSHVDRILALGNLPNLNTERREQIESAAAAARVRPH